MTDPPAAGRPSAFSRYSRFLLASAAIAILWTVILPWLAARPRMAEHIDWLEARGIDAGVMYYTELEAMKPILQRLERPNRKEIGANALRPVKPQTTDFLLRK